MIPRRVLELLFYLSLVFSLTLASCAAQTKAPNEDQQSATDFVGSLAKTIYSAAWPTATYKGFSLDSVHAAQGGFDVYVRIYGLSGLDNSDLWLRLALEIRGDGLHDLHVQDHNGFFPPFWTITNLGKAVVAVINQQNQSSQTPSQSSAPPSPPSVPVRPVTPSPPPQAEPEPPAQPQLAGATCITNPTNDEISLQYLWAGQENWSPITIPAHKMMALWWPYEGSSRSSPKLTIDYDGDFAPGFQEQSYDLDRMQAPLPINCDYAANYIFVIEGQKIIVQRSK